MRAFILYGTSACHLCELAEAVLANVLAVQPDWQIELIDICIPEIGNRNCQVIGRI